MKTGILGFQGDYSRHGAILDQLGLGHILIRYPDQLLECNGLIIPGGESSTMTKIIRAAGFRQPLLDFADKYPVLGTCAGMIMMGQEIDDERIDPLGIIDIKVTRNAYGRQVASFSDNLQVRLNGNSENIESTFIRAPQVSYCGKDVEILAEYNNQPVAVRQHRHIALAFHPELDNVTVFHQLAFMGK